MDRLSAFFDLVQQDPVLSRVKLIAEPWDVGEGGYQVGNFPPLWSEWNGKYRDPYGTSGAASRARSREFATRLTGSLRPLRSDGRRRPRASVNFVTAHDGFTLRDLVSYNDKHNEANGEDNRDGENDNRSLELRRRGPDRRPGRPRRCARASSATSWPPCCCRRACRCSAHGDELGRTQGGNNNAYCQDNEVSWLDWRLTEDQQALADFTRYVIGLRAAHPVLRRRRFFRGETVTHAGQPLPDLVWLLPDAREMADEDWDRSDAHSVGVFLNGDAIAEPDPCGEPVVDDSFLLLLNGYWEPVDFLLPDVTYGRTLDDADRHRRAAGRRRGRAQGGHGDDGRGTQSRPAVEALAQGQVTLRARNRGPGPGARGRDLLSVSVRVARSP